MTYQGHPDQYYGHITYSQHGEDHLILDLFRQMGIDKPSYLDLGAHHPFHISNTALMYSRGSRGVNVEANPNLIEAFREYRPEDINLNIGVAPAEGELDFHMYDDTSGRNTFCVNEVRAYGQKVNKVIKVKVITLPQLILLEGVFHSFPDFLNCDLEGLDYDVLCSLSEFDPKNRPKIICVETRQEDIKKMCILLEEELGYGLMLRIGENCIFMRRDCFKELYV